MLRAACSLARAEPCRIIASASVRASVSAFCAAFSCASSASFRAASSASGLPHTSATTAAKTSTRRIVRRAQISMKHAGAGVGKLLETLRHVFFSCLVGETAPRRELVVWWAFLFFRVYSNHFTLHSFHTVRRAARAKPCRR